MLPEKYEKLLSFVSTLITKSSLRRECISADQRLCMTMRYLVIADAKATIVVVIVWVLQQLVELLVKLAMLSGQSCWKTDN